jgi:glucan biosynthesis protein C
VRKTYLDNVRWGTVLLVLVYHVCYLFNGVGIPGGIPGAKSIPALDAFASLIYPWFMVLLFAIAGMSARYALQKRTVGQFLRERAVKLLVPSTLGLFVLHWITGLLNMKIGGALGLMPPALLYPIAVLSGIGPLWFVQMLFLFSCVLIPLRKLDKAERLWTLCGRAGVPAAMLLAVLIFGAAQVLNLPVLTMYRFGIYFAAFLIGYYVLSHDGVQDALEKGRVPLLCLAALGAIAYALVYRGRDYTAPSVLKSLLTNLYLWMAVLAVLGGAKKHLNKENALTRYMTGASYGVYVLHYPVLLAAGYVLNTYFDLPALLNYGITLVVGVVFTFALYEAVRRIPLLRTLVLGIKRPR